MLPNSHSGQYCTHSAVSALTSEQDDLGSVRVQSDLQHHKSTGDTKIVVILYMRQIHTFTLSTSSNGLNYNPSLKKFHHFLCYKNGILRGLGKTRGYLGCPQAKAKLNFASQKMEQDSVMTRKKEEQIQD